MATPWNQVAQSPDFQNLPPEQQEAAHQQYFDQVVAPNVPPEHVDVARHQFFMDTAPATPPQNSDFLSPDPSAPELSMIEGAKAVGRGVKALYNRAVSGPQPAGSDTDEDPNILSGNEMSVVGGLTAAPSFAKALPSTVKAAGDIGSQMKDAFGNFMDKEAAKAAAERGTNYNFTGPSGKPVNSNDTLMGVANDVPKPTDAQAKAWGILNQTAKEHNISLDDAAAQARENTKKGLPLANLDALTQDVDGSTTSVGRGFQALARAAVQRPGEGASYAAELASRGSNIKDYLNNFLDKHFSTGDMYQTLDQANAGMTAARPQYEAAMDQKPVWNDRIQMFLNDPDIKAGIPAGIRQQRLEALARGETPQPYDKSVIDFNEAGDPVIGNVPNMRLIDAAKKGIDAKLDAAQSARQFQGRPTGEERALAGAKTAFLKEVDAVNPQYAAARQSYADPASIATASEMGRNYSKMDPEEIQRYFSDPETTDAQKAAFKEGARYDIGDNLSRLRDNSNGIDSFWKQSTRDRLAPMMQNSDPQSFQALGNGINDLRRMSENNQILKGSQTAENQQYNKLIEEPVGNKLTTALKYITNPRVAVARDAASYLSDHLKSQASNMSSETAAELMKVLASKDPDQLAAVSLWGKHNGY